MGTRGGRGGVREDVHPSGPDCICWGAGWEIPGEYRAQTGTQSGWRVWSVKGRGRGRWERSWKEIRIKERGLYLGSGDPLKTLVKGVI